MFNVQSKSWTDKAQKSFPIGEYICSLEREKESWFARPSIICEAVRFWIKIEYESSLIKKPF